MADVIGRAIIQVVTQLDQTSTARISSQLTSVGKRLTTGLTVPLVAAGAASLKVAGDFDRSFSVLQAAIGASNKQISSLEKQAESIGPQFGITANQGATAMVALGKAGETATQIMKTFPNVMKLAATEGMSMDDAANDVVATLSQFQLGPAKAAQVVNAFSGAATASRASVAGLAQSMTLVGGAAHLTGVTVQQTAGALAELSQGGLDGSIAGTSLASVLNHLIPRTKIAGDTIKQLGLSFTTSSGGFKTLPTIIDELQKKLGGLPPAVQKADIGKIFGRDASVVQAVVTLLQGGTEGLAKYTKAASDMGSATRQAQARTEGFAGSMDKMKAAVGVAGINLGNVLAPGVQKLAGYIQTAATAFADLPRSTQTSIATFGGIAAAIGPVTVGFGALAGSIGAIGELFGGLSAAPLIAITGAVTGLAVGFVDLYRNSASFRDTIDTAFTSIKQTAIPVIHDMETTVTQELIPALKSIAQSWAGTALVKGIETTAKDATVALGGLVKTVSGVTQAISGLLTMNFGQVGGGLTNMFGGLTTMLPVIGIAMLKFRTQITGAMTAASTAVSGLGTNLRMIGTDMRWQQSMNNLASMGIVTGNNINMTTRAMASLRTGLTKLAPAASIAGMLALADGMNRVNTSGTTLAGTLEVTLGGAMAGSMLGPLGALVGGGGGLLYALSRGFNDSAKSAGELTRTMENTQWAQKLNASIQGVKASLDQETGAFTRASKAALYHELQTNGMAAAASKAGIPMQTLIAATMGNANAQEYLSKQLSQSHINQLNSTKATQDDALANYKQANALDELRTLYPGLAKEHQNQRASLQAETIATKGLNAVLGLTKAQYANIPKQVRSELVLNGLPQTETALANFVKKYGRSSFATARVIARIDGLDVSTKQLNQWANSAKRTSTDTGTAMGRNTGSGMQKGLNSSRGPVINTLFNLIQNARSQGTTAATRGGTNMGQALGSGSVKGINSTRGRVSAAAGALIKGNPAAANRAGVGEGGSFGSGVYSGINAWVGRVAAAAANLVSAAMNAARHTQNSHSPSREMIKEGQNFATGYAVGIDMSTGKVTRIGSDMVVNTRKGAEKATKTELKRWRKIGNDIILAWREGMVGGGADAVKSLNDIAGDLRDNGERAGANVVRAFVARLGDIPKEYDRLTTRIKAATDTLTSLQKTATDTASDIMSSFNLTSLDVSQVVPSNVFSSIVDQFKSARDQTKEWTAALAQLRKEGIRKDLFQQFVAAGPSALGEVQSILANKGVAQINALQAQIARSANQAGLLMADSVRPGGVAAAQAFVNTLQRKQNALVRQFNTIADRFGLRLQKAVNRTVGGVTIRVTPSTTRPGATGRAGRLLAPEDYATPSVVHTAARTARTPATARATQQVTTGTTQVAQQATAAALALRPVVVNQNFYGPQTGRDRVRELRWAIRFSPR